MNRPTNDQRCSFCGKGLDGVRDLLSGSTVDASGHASVAYICDECVALASQIFARPQSRPAGEPAWATFVHQGCGYEWLEVPDEEQDQRVILVRRLGATGSSGFGYVVPWERHVDSALLAFVVESFGDRL